MACSSGSSGNTVVAQEGMGTRGNAPGEAVAHLEPVKGLAEHGAGLLSPDQPVGVHALQRFRIAGGNGQIGRAHFAHSW